MKPHKKDTDLHQSADNEEQMPQAEEVNEVEPAAEPQTDEWQTKYEELSDTHLRLMAEYDNYRKRTLREKAELIKSAGESVLVNILPLVDDFERGIDAAKKADDIDALREGMQLIYTKLLAFLKQNGISVIETERKDFDTQYHEAITMLPVSDEEQKGKIIDCVQKGYMLNDKVIRFAKVVVGQ